MKNKTSESSRKIVQNTNSIKSTINPVERDEFKFSRFNVRSGTGGYDSEEIADFVNEIVDTTYVRPSEDVYSVTNCEGYSMGFQLDLFDCYGSAIDKQDEFEDALREIESNYKNISIKYAEICASASEVEERIMDVAENHGVEDEMYELIKLLCENTIHRAWRKYSEIISDDLYEVFEDISKTPDTTAPHIDPNMITLADTMVDQLGRTPKDDWNEEPVVINCHVEATQPDYV